MFDAAVVLYAETTKSDNSSGSRAFLRKKLRVVPSTITKNISDLLRIIVKKCLVPIKTTTAVTYCTISIIVIKLRYRGLTVLKLNNFCTCSKLTVPEIFFARLRSLNLFTIKKLLCVPKPIVADRCHRSYAWYGIQNMKAWPPIFLPLNITRLVAMIIRAITI
ncbi:hypothetical protein V1478_012609 [Vespula squamosa]|uniref:Uncharacterized protein n=1 Tax=Vespula squamosa TaxID=30214 RepID=A0ABD2A8E4_VESSQ